MVRSTALSDPSGMKAEDLDLDAQVPLESVQLDGLVAMKIIKHCSERQSGTVTGQLLGLDVDGCLEVTNCFPQPQPNKGSQDDNTNATLYQMDMLRALRDVNADHNVVGWYQSARHGSFVTQALVEAQYDYQKKLNEKCVVLIYDTSSSARGNFAIRAYRLTSNFMRAFRTRSLTTESLRKFKLNSESILEELPVKVRNSTLAEVLLDELDTIEHPVECDMARLELRGTHDAERGLDALTSGVDDWRHEQGQWLYWLRGAQRDQARIQQAIQKRKGENKERIAAGLDPLPDEPEDLPRLLPEPSRLEQMLNSRQMTVHARQLESSAGVAISRLYTTQAVQQ